MRRDLQKLSSREREKSERNVNVSENGKVKNEISKVYEGKLKYYT